MTARIRRSPYEATSRDLLVAAGVADHKWSLYEIAALLDSN